MTDRPLTRKYSRVERERRFVLDSVPAAADVENFVRLHDTFVEGAYLRIRRVERPDGTEIITKLGQKIVDGEAPADPTRREMTTIYLAPGQAAHLSCLEGPGSVKRRYKIVEQGWTWMIDVWETPAHAAGLILAEVECPSDAELARITMPSWAVREVTNDPSYSAFTLARQ